MSLTYYTAQRHLLALGICAGDTITLNAINPEEPVMIHRPALGVDAQTIAEAVAAGLLAPVSPSASPVVPFDVPPAPPRLRLLPRDDRRSA